MKLTYVVLAVAIVFEVIATSALKQSDGFTKAIPSIIALAGYGVAFYFLSLTLRTLPVGVMYAIWSGAGIVLITLVGWIVYQQKLDAAALIGMAISCAAISSSMASGIGMTLLAGAVKYSDHVPSTPVTTTR